MIPTGRDAHVNKVLWNGRIAAGAIHASDLFSLPVITPFGSIQLKLLKLRERVSHINRRVDDAWSEWRQGGAGTPVDSHHEPLIIEEVMYSIRRATDEILSIRWLLAEHGRTGEFPNRLKVDSIDSALRASDPLIEHHREFLEFCNGASNAYKHSFLQTDLTLMGADEPCVFALRLPRNHADKQEEFYSATLNAVVGFFSSFLNDSIADLRERGRKFQLDGGGDSDDSLNEGNGAGACNSQPIAHGDGR